MTSCNNKKNIVTTTDGKISGTLTNGIYSYKGVPYAKDNNKDFLYSTPKNLDHYDGVIDCTKYRHSCYQQPDNSLNITPKQTGYDCLNLNIWTPTLDHNANLPVYVWIHGGGFSIGSGNEALYDGTNYAKNNIVFVDISYRLNFFGFLTLNSTRTQALNDLDQPLYWTDSTHSSTTTTPSSVDQVNNPVYTNGNWGILDQIKALQWVHKNISNFGGNPENVTIGGESAGSMSVSALIISPAGLPQNQSDGKPLFQRAIMESGNILGCNGLSCYTSYMDLPHSIQESEFALSFFGITDSQQGLETIKNYSNPQEFANITSLRWDFDNIYQVINNYPLFPTYDGWALPLVDSTHSLFDCIDSGEFNDVDMIIGWNKDEGMLFCLNTPYNPFSMAESSYGQNYDWCFENNVQNRIRNIKNEEMNYDYYKTNFLPSSVYPSSDAERANCFRELLKLSCFSAPSLAFANKINEYREENSITNKHTYVYNFEYTPDFNPYFYYQAPMHMCELFFTFNNFVFGGNPLTNVSNNDRSEGNTIFGHWCNFINGNIDSNSWNPYTSSSPSSLHFTNDGNTMGDLEDGTNVTNLANWFLE